MTPQALAFSAAAEVLDLIADSRASADAVLRAWGRGHRFAGSGDRRAIGERVYACLRGRARFGWRMGAEDGRALVLGSLGNLAEIEPLFTGEGHAPAKLSDDEAQPRLSNAPANEPTWVQAGIPEWLVPEFERAFGCAAWIDEARALLTRRRAPVDLRVQHPRRITRRRPRPPQRDPDALVRPGPCTFPPPETDVQSSDAFREGRIEIQDESSQIAAWLSGAAPGMTVVDYCAGGGGKTLALASSPPFRPSSRACPGTRG